MSFCFDELCSIISRLRAPNGCPWDREQTPQTLRTCLIEECFEVVNAIDRKATYSAGEEFKFQLTVSNNSPVDVVWFFDDVEQDSNVSSINLSAGEHTVVAVLTYSDGSTERITTKLNVQ